MEQSICRPTPSQGPATVPRPTVCILPSDHATEGLGVRSRAGRRMHGMDPFPGRETRGEGSIAKCAGGYGPGGRGTNGWQAASCWRASSRPARRASSQLADGMRNTGSSPSSVHPSIHPFLLPSFHPSSQHMPVRGEVGGDGNVRPAVVPSLPSF